MKNNFLGAIKQIFPIWQLISWRIFAELMKALQERRWLGTIVLIVSNYAFSPWVVQLDTDL